MINKNKVALMTKMAIYEQGEGRKSIPMSKYYKNDYLSLKIINSVIVVTLSFFLIIGLYVLVNFEKLLEEMVSMDLLEVGKQMLIGYVILIVISLVLTRFMYGKRFKQYRKGLNEYNGNLKKLYTISKNESKTNRAGGFEDEESFDN